MADRYIVCAVDWLIPALAGHAGRHYESPPQSEEQARALIRLLAGIPHTSEGDGPWERAVAGGRRTVTLRRCRES